MSMTRGTNPEREAVKEYLQQYHDAKVKKRILEERHRTLSAELRDPGVGSTYRTMPTAKRQAREGGAVSLVYRISEVEDRIDQQREAMAKAVLHVMDMIDILPQNSMERTVVEMRHIDCKPWEKIAQAVHMSRSRVFDYYNAALDTLLACKRTETGGGIHGRQREKQARIKDRTSSDFLLCYIDSMEIGRATRETPGGPPLSIPEPGGA